MREILKDEANDDLLDLVLQHIPAPIEAGSEPTPGAEEQKAVYAELANIAYSNTIALTSDLRY